MRTPFNLVRSAALALAVTAITSPAGTALAQNLGNDIRPDRPRDAPATLSPKRKGTISFTYTYYDRCRKRRFTTSSRTPPKGSLPGCVTLESFYARGSY